MASLKSGPVESYGLLHLEVGLRTLHSQPIQYCGVAILFVGNHVLCVSSVSGILAATQQDIVVFCYIVRSCFER